MQKKRNILLSSLGLSLLLAIVAISVDTFLNTPEQNHSSNTYASTTIPAAPVMGVDPWPTYVDNNTILNEQFYENEASVMHNETFPIWDGSKMTMQQLGYTYDTLDDDWAGKRTSAGLQPNLTYFPNMTGMITYIHNFGLKIGLYTSVGNATCLGNLPGSLGYEAIDGKEFQNWGVDYMKLDWCGGGTSLSTSWVESDLKKWRSDLGPNIVIGTNTGGAATPWTFASKDNTVNAFRISPSIKDWREGSAVPDAEQWNGGQGSVMNIINSQNGSVLSSSHAAPEHWSDGGYMHTGVNLSLNESKSEFSMWSMVSSPLVIGADITKMQPGDITSQVIFNTEIIAVDQDPLVVQATKKTTINGVEVWEKPMSNNTYAVAFLNPNSSSTNATVTWSQVGIPTSSMPSTGYYTRDLWTHTDTGQFTQGYSALNIPSHGITVIKVASSVANLLPPGYTPPTPSPTATPMHTPTPTSTPKPTATPTPKPTATATPTHVSTPTPTQQQTNTPTPTVVQTTAIATQTELAQVTQTTLPTQSPAIEETSSSATTESTLIFGWDHTTFTIIIVVLILLINAIAFIVIKITSPTEDLSSILPPIQPPVENPPQPSTV